MINSQSVVKVNIKFDEDDTILMNERKMNNEKRERERDVMSRSSGNG